MSDKESTSKNWFIGTVGAITPLIVAYWAGCSPGTFFCLRPSPPVPNPSGQTLSTPNTSDPSAGVPTIDPNLSECSKENFKSMMVGIDYSNLCGFLQQKKWKQADSETLNLLLKLSDVQGRRVLDSQEIKRLQCTDLKTIDNLWLKYSSNIFGFSEQNKIWQENNGSREDSNAGWDSMVKTGYDFGWMTSPNRFNADGSKKVGLKRSPDQIVSKVDPSRRGMLPRLADADGDGWEIRKHFSYLWDKISDCS